MKAAVKATVHSDVVIRTKAMRCTQQVVLVDPHPEAACAPMLGSGTGNGREEGSPSMASKGDDSGKLGLDSSMSELLLKDMSDPEFWKIYPFSSEFNLDGNGHGSLNIDDLLYSEEMMKNWGNHQDDFL
ncbi:hypothetical protein MLD38_015125 [Melastoma candidum]|nr:hypothetical protein MLD38_015125 [Melastoma candidum]